MSSRLCIKLLSCSAYMYYIYAKVGSGLDILDVARARNFRIKKNNFLPKDHGKIKVIKEKKKN